MLTITITYTTSKKFTEKTLTANGKLKTANGFMRDSKRDGTRNATRQKRDETAREISAKLPRKNLLGLKNINNNNNI